VEAVLCVTLLLEWLTLTDGMACLRLKKKMVHHPRVCVFGSKNGHFILLRLYISGLVKCGLRICVFQYVYVLHLKCYAV
jgi:hypothetical protein